MSFPTNKFESFTFEQVDDIRLGKARLNRNRAQGSKDSFFKLIATTPRMKYAEGKKVGAYIRYMKSGLIIEDIPNPIPPIGDESTLRVAATADRRANVVSIKNIVNGLKAGDLLSFSSHRKLYEVAIDTGTGTQDVTLTSPLVAKVLTNNIIKYGSDVVWRVSLLSANSASVTETSVSENLEIVHDVELIEQL